MKLPVNVGRGARRAPIHLAFSVLALAALALSSGACGHDVGDQCTTSVDCDPNGTRSCDLSQPNGYCTIVGCDATVALCPDSSACIRVFPTKYLTTTCDPKCEDVCLDPIASAKAMKSKMVDACLPEEVCVGSSASSSGGFCAKQTSEQRYCAKTCSHNSDCRAGYECRPVGENGSLLLTPDVNVTTSFCAPYVPPAATPDAGAAG